MEDKTLNMTLLFDFFGDLLTEKQREYFDLYYNEDLSLSEIAENAGISRQGVRDLIVRAENFLLETERKTGIVARFEQMQQDIARAERCAQKLRAAAGEALRPCADELLDVLQSLKG